VEIGDKKCSKNFVADHLSRIEPCCSRAEGEEIKEAFPDESLFAASILP